MLSGYEVLITLTVTIWLQRQMVPIEESEMPPTLEAVEYATPETPVLETVIESPGYAVPGELTFSWVPGYVPVPGAATVSEEGNAVNGTPASQYVSGVGRNTGRRFRNHGSVPTDHAVARGGYGASCGNRECARD